MTVQDEPGGLVGAALRVGHRLIGLRVMWLFDVAAHHWTRGKEGLRIHVDHIS